MTDIDFPPFTQPLALVTRESAGVDGDGNDKYVDAVRVVFGVFAPGGSTEVTEGGERVITQPSALLPSETPVRAIDALVDKPVLDAAGAPVLDGAGKVQGDWYEIAGDESDWRSPFEDWNPGIQVPLRRVAG